MPLLARSITAILLLVLASCSAVSVTEPSRIPTLTVDDGPQTVGEYTVTPEVASPLVAGVDLVLIWSVTKRGENDPTRFVINRAASRAVIVNGTTREPVPSKPVDRGGHGGMLALEGNQVAFGTTLPAPGRYIVTTELTVDGQPITVRNVYDAVALPAGISSEGEADHSMMTGEMQTIRIEAYQWGYDPAVIRVPRGTHLMLQLTSRDVPHSFNLEGYGLSQSILPGQTSTLDFIADRPGTFVYGCDVACGDGHDDMQRGGGTLIVE